MTPGRPPLAPPLRSVTSLRRLGLLIPLVSLVVCLTLAGGSDAASPRALGSGQPREYQVKAAFLLNFLRFVEWPAQAFPAPDSPIVIGILGEDPFGPELASMARAKTIEGRPVIVRAITTPEEAARCHLAFVGATERGLSGRLAAVAPPSVLTVGEVERFAERGGVIQFIPENNRIRFLVNPTAARRANLQLSAKLLSSAIIVRDSREGDR